MSYTWVQKENVFSAFIDDNVILFLYLEVIFLKGVNVEKKQTFFDIYE